MSPGKENSTQLTPQQEDYIEVENHCCLCGTELVFNHQMVLETPTVRENAHCPCCKIQLKEKQFTLH